MDAGGARGSRDGGSSDRRKRKGDKKKDDKPKERKRGYGVARLEMIRIQTELAEQQRKQNSLNQQQGPPQIPDGTTDGVDIAAIRGSVYPWSMHANVAPSLPPPCYSPHLAMHYRYDNAARGAINFGHSQSTPFRSPGASGSYPAPNNIRPPGAPGTTYPPNPNNIRPLGAPTGTTYPPNPNNIRPPGTFGASSYYPNNPNNIRPPGAFGAAYYPYSNNIMPPANEVTMAQPLSQVPNSQELIDLTREEEGHNKSAGESTSKNSDEDQEGLDLELRL